MQSNIRDMRLLFRQYAERIVSPLEILLLKVRQGRRQQWLGSPAMSALENLWSDSDWREWLGAHHESYEDYSSRQRTHERLIEVWDEPAWKLPCFFGVSESLRTEFWACSTEDTRIGAPNIGREMHNRKVNARWIQNEATNHEQKRIWKYMHGVKFLWRTARARQPTSNALDPAADAKKATVIRKAHAWHMLTTMSDLCCRASSR